MRSYVLPAALALGFTLCSVSTATGLDGLTGHWQLNASQSTPGDDETRALDIKQSGNNVVVIRTYSDKHGQQETETFKCSLGGQQCQMLDGSRRKAQVSFWQDGDGLVLLKTNGDVHDSTVEWHFRIEDATRLKVTREIMEPLDKKESLVFNRVEAVAAK